MEVTVSEMGSNRFQQFSRCKRFRVCAQEFMTKDIFGRLGSGDERIVAVSES